jgi:hypothetical protein
MAYQTEISEVRKMMCMMEIALHFSYAQAMVENANCIATRRCYGCEIDHPSQREHSCIMLSGEERLDYYGDEALESLDEEELLTQWRASVQTVYKDNVTVNKLFQTFLNKDWRETMMKTNSWKHKIIVTAHRLIKLEHRFC